MKVEKYHINRETGNVGLCTANVRECPFGTIDEHFDSKDEAQNHYELIMSHNIIHSIKGSDKDKIVLNSSSSSESHNNLPLKKVKVYRVGTLNAPEEYFDDLKTILQDMDKFKPEGRQGRFQGIFASPDLNSHARWVRGNSWNKHEGALDSHEITVDANSVYVYNIEDYEKASSIQRMYGADSEKFKESAESFWNSGMTLAEWQEWAKENKPERGSWEIIMPPEAMISTKKLSNRAIIESSDDFDADELNRILEPNRWRKGLIWRKRTLSDKIKNTVKQKASANNLDEIFVNDMENIYSKNAYKIDDLYSAQKEIYSAIIRAKKKRGEKEIKTFANLTRDEQKEFLNNVKTYIQIVEETVEKEKQEKIN